MNVNISYSERQGINLVTSNYKILEPIMDIHLNLAGHGTTGFHSDLLQGRTLRIIKERPGDHDFWGISDCLNRCDRGVTIVLWTPAEECTTFEVALKHLVRPATCDNNLCLPESHSYHLTSSVETAYQALDIINAVSKDFFGAQKDKWLEAAKQFIGQGPQSRRVTIELNPEFEATLRRTLGDQPGAMNLLNDLKQKPFNHGVQTILERLFRGVYGDFSSNKMPSVKLESDLESRGLKDLAKFVNEGRYDHDGPNAQENISELLATIEYDLLRH